MAPSHFLAVVALGLVASRWRPFSRRDWALAVGFGVVIDLDHVLQLPQYVAAHGGASAVLAPSTMVHWGHAWQGFMHTPWAVVLIVPAMLAWRSLLPAFFWALHMVQDFVVATRFVVFGSLVEWTIVLALALLVCGLLWSDPRRRASSARFVVHVANVFGLRGSS